MNQSGCCIAIAVACKLGKVRRRAKPAAEGDRFREETLQLVSQ